MDDEKNKHSIELSKMKTRIAIMESKQTTDSNLPDLESIPTLLHYFNLTTNSTDEDIRKTINLRMLEASTDSVVSAEIFTTMSITEDERENREIFCNKAMDVLLKWSKEN